MPLNLTSFDSIGRPILWLLVLVFVSGCSVNLAPAPTATVTPTVTPQATSTPIPGIGERTIQTINVSDGGTTTAHEYILYLPEDYSPDTEWPLIVYLHGAGARGSDIQRVRSEAFVASLGVSLDLPAIIVAPQAPDGQIWDNRLPTLEAFLAAVEQDYAVDSRRIYLTGFSMGGFGTWAWGLSNPDRFAALVPVAGGSFGNSRPDNMCDLGDTAVWVFVSTADRVVPASLSESLVEQLQECGAENVQITVYDDANHGITGSRPYVVGSKLYDWLLQQELPAGKVSAGS